MAKEAEQPPRDPEKQYYVPLMLGERLMPRIASILGRKVEIERSTVVSGQEINEFCDPCDLFQANGTCRAELDSDRCQLLSVARGSCGFARKDGREGVMTENGFIPNVLQIARFRYKRS